MDARWWAVWSTDPKRSPNTIAAYESRLDNHVRPFFRKLRLGQITVMTCRKWQNELPLSWATIMNCRTILYSMLEAAVLEKWLPDNPLKYVQAPEKPYSEGRGIRRAAAGLLRARGAWAAPGRRWPPLG